MEIFFSCRTGDWIQTLPGKNMNIFILCDEYDLLYIESRFWYMVFRFEMTSGADLLTDMGSAFPRGECLSHA